MQLQESSALVYGHLCNYRLLAGDAQAACDGRRAGFSRATKLPDALQNNERMQHCCVLVLSTHGESAEMRREPKRAGYLRWATGRLLSSNEAVGRFAEQRTDAALLPTRSLHARRKRRNA